MQTLLPIFCFFISLLLCKWIRDISIKRSLVDRPNERSLHNVPVPRLGGIAIVVSVLAFVLVSAAIKLDSIHRDLIWVMVGALCVAILGAVDDIQPLRARTRLLVQVLIAFLVCFQVGVRSDNLLVQTISIHVPTYVALVLWVFWIVAVLNIYNFMDGMDGLAATQSIGGLVAVGSVFGGLGHADIAQFATLGIASVLGFVFFNFPPAKMFMGDAGSTAIGFSLAASVFLGAQRASSVPIVTIPIAIAPFLFDGVFTLFRRIRNREQIWEAHRSHLYQRAVGSGLSQHEVLFVYLIWTIVALVGALLSVRASPMVLMGICFVVIVFFILVWRWVVSHESKNVSKEIQ